MALEKSTLIYINLSSYSQSDEYLDSVCEERNSQQPVVNLSTNNEEFCLPEEAIGSLDLQKGVEDENPVMSFKNQLTQMQHDSNIHTDNMGDENATKLQMPEKDWTMEDVDEYYTKVNEEEIEEPLNADLCAQQPKNTKETEVNDKVNSRTYIC